MTTVMAAPTTVSLAPSSSEPRLSPKSYAAGTSSAPPFTPSAIPPPSPSSTPTHSSGVANDSQASKPTSEDGPSPKSLRSGPPPKIIVKKEPPGSPEPPTARHRPRKLDLSTSTQASAGRPSAGPFTAKDSAGFVMHDVGLACLSPGFQTQDPTMREQLQRSISVRDQQRHIIESRLQKTAKPGDVAEGQKTSDNAFGAPSKTPSRKKAPPGLSIVPPSHEQFANERVIQSAPLNQTFTGRHQPHPMTRHVANQPSNLSNTSHIHHVPATQTNNRLPPISDVFASEGLGSNRESNSRGGYYPPNSASNSSHSNNRQGFPSPGLPPVQSQGPTSGRPREYRSAEEAVASMSGGREDLLPKIVHYGGHQPPTPPSPLPANGYGAQTNGQIQENSNRIGTSRRRPRSEYERDMGTPPLGPGPEARRGPFGEERDSPDAQQKKKEEFISLCARAWDLFHS
ncbi:MAG: hypothetical protein M1819_007225 [Sarea resinae]|nr:MAG: hypothetical protein M1819_007225 [Sarea resinae]